MHGIHTEKCGLFGMYFEHNSRAQVYGWTDVGSSGSIELSGSPGDTGHDVLVDGFRWTAPATGTYNGWLTLFGRLTLMNGTADMTSTSGQKALCDWGSASDGTLFIENVRTISGAFGLYLEDGANQRVIRGANVDLSSTSTPYRRGNQSKLNFGTVTLNGASDVVVSGAFLADQPIALSFNTLSGSLGAYPTIKAKSADSFTVKGTAGDNSVYDWAAK